MLAKLDPWALLSRMKETVPAYAQFLHDANYADAAHGNWSDVPCMDKNNYVHRFSLQDLFPDGRVAPVGHSSSGSSGKPTFWFRGPKQKAMGAVYYARIVDRVMGIPPSDNTLVVVCFGMGVWVAGQYTLLAFADLGEQAGRQLSVLSPGMEVDEICSILGRLSGHFDHTVLVGYPAALDLLIEQLYRRHVELPRRLRLITSGDKISETWRSAKMADLGIAEPRSIVNVYGSSDGGILAIETPLSIELRRHLEKHPDLQKQVLGHSLGSPPALFQYDPAFIAFEEIAGELVLTADLDLPLVRYNIHDRGRVLSYDAMMALVGELPAQPWDGWQYPFVSVSGRTDVAVNFYGVKVYPEVIQKGLQAASVREHLSGSFVAFTLAQERGELFCLNLQLSGQADDADLVSLIENVVQERLLAESHEYRHLCAKLGRQVNRPRVRLYAHNDAVFPDMQRQAWSVEAQRQEMRSAFFWQAGKKPRVVTAR